MAEVLTTAELIEMRQFCQDWIHNSNDHHLSNSIALVLIQNELDRRGAA